MINCLNCQNSRYQNCKLSKMNCALKTCNYTLLSHFPQMFSSNSAYTLTLNVQIVELAGVNVNNCWCFSIWISNFFLSPLSEITFWKNSREKSLKLSAYFHIIHTSKQRVTTSLFYFQLWTSQKIHQNSH